MRRWIRLQSCMVFKMLGLSEGIFCGGRKIMVRYPSVKDPACTFGEVEYSAGGFYNRSAQNSRAVRV